MTRRLLPVAIVILALVAGCTSTSSYPTAAASSSESAAGTTMSPVVSPNATGVPTTDPCGVLSEAVRDAESALEGDFARLDADPKGVVAALPQVAQSFDASVASLPAGSQARTSADAVHASLAGLSEQTSGAVHGSSIDGDQVRAAVAETQTQFLQAVKTCTATPTATPAG